MSTSVSESNAVFDVDAASFETRVVAASHQRPVLVDFWADWCGPCKALAPTLEKLAREAAGDFVLAKVDTDANRELAAAQGIRSLPTVRLFVDGAAVAEFMGAHPESSIRAFLAQHLPVAVDDSALAAVEALLDSGDAAAAASAIEALDEPVRETPLGQRLSARLWLLERLAALDESEAADEFDDAYRQALSLAAAQRHEEALEALLGIIARRRNFADGAARDAMLQIFQVLGSDDPRVTTYRGRLASTLN